MSDFRATLLARRRFLAAAGGAGLTGLAGCSTQERSQSPQTTGKPADTPKDRTRSGYGAGGYGEGRYGSPE